MSTYVLFRMHVALHSIFATAAAAAAAAVPVILWAQYWRNPTYNFLRIVLSILVALVFSSSFIDAGEAQFTPTGMGCLHTLRSKTNPAK